MNGLHRVGSLATLRSGAPMKAVVEGQVIAVFALGEDVIATNGRCPHAKGPLHEGEIEGEKLICPWHGWTYNLRTGACDEDDSLTLERFDVSINGDDILVRL